MKTRSEEVFEDFLSSYKLPFEKIKESDSKRPDYSVQIGDAELIFEVKELTEHDQLETIGGPIRRAIDGSRKQVKYGANQGVPSVLLIYNRFDPCQSFGTDDLDFTTAMYGELTALIDRETGESTEMFYGRNSLLQESKNTSFSAVGRLAERFESAQIKTIELTLFENAYSKIALPWELLPSCFVVRRVNILNTPLKFT